MGLKLRMGLAMTGLALSSMFGVNMLAGVKDYVDTTGNIMVDIADGIGMVSKGIEALEFWLDPDQSSQTESAQDDPPPLATTVKQDPVPEQDLDQPKVFCQKGKCYPYDPARMKNPNVNLEMKPGMILTAPELEPSQKRSRGNSRDTEGVGGSQRPQGKASEETVTSPPIAASQPELTDSNNVSTSQHGTRKLLSSLRNLLDVINKVLVKLVYKIFPWNRRARRRVLGDGEEEEL